MPEHLEGFPGVGPNSFFVRDGQTIPCRVTSYKSSKLIEFEPLSDGQIQRRQEEAEKIARMRARFMKSQDRKKRREAAAEVHAEAV